jgi:hypothetical protein
MSSTSFVEKIKTHILSSINFFFENNAVYEIISKNVVKSGGGGAAQITSQYGAYTLHA